MQKNYNDYKIIDENKFEEMSLAYAKKLARVKTNSVGENIDDKLKKMLENLNFCLHILNNLILGAKNKDNLEIFLFTKNQIEEFLKKLQILYERENVDKLLEIKNEILLSEKVFTNEFISFLQNLFEFLGSETNVKIKISLENMMVEGLNVLKEFNKLQVSKQRIFSLFKK